jgi:hypothetical protein
MGLFKKIFGDDEEKEREEAAKRKAAEQYAEQHAHGHSAEGAHEPAAKKTAAKKATEKAAAKAEPEKPAAKPAAAKTAAAKGAEPKAEAPAKKTAAAAAAVPAARKATEKVAEKPAAKPAAKAEAPAKADAHTHDPIPAQRTYAPNPQAAAAVVHQHAHVETDGPITAEHDQMMTIHVETHVPDHAPREDDPHYHLFEQAKARLKRQGLWKCMISDDLCGGEPELHHTFIEFSQINEVDPKKVQEALGLHFDSDEAFQQWAESPGNLEVLCSGHHRAHYGIHVIPGPLWEAIRFRLPGTEAAAEFVSADEAKEEAKKEVAS